MSIRRCQTMSERISLISTRCVGQGGFSLLEVLISVVVLSIGLLGMAGLQANALRNTQSSLQRTQVSMLNHLIFDAMRANRAVSYALAKTCDVPESAGSLAERDMKYWLERIQRNLGEDEQSCGEIACEDRVCTVRIYWNDSRGTEAQALEECGLDPDVDKGWTCFSMTTRL